MTRPPASREPDRAVPAREIPIVLPDILVQSNGIGLLDEGRVVKWIPRDEIQGIFIRRGFLAAHSWAELAVGVVLSLVGLASIRSLLAILGDPRAPVEALGLLSLLLPIGVWLAHDALKRGVYWEVHSARGRLRIPIDRRITVVEIDAFVTEAQERLRCSIADSRRDRT